MARAIEAFKKKFSKEAADYTVYFETDSNFVQLDPSAHLNEIPNLKNNVCMCGTEDESDVVCVFGDLLLLL